MAHLTKLKRCIREHVKAQIDLSYKGGADTKEWPAIDREAARAKKRMNEALASVEIKLNNPDR